MSFAPNLHDKAVIVQLHNSFSWGTITDKVITEETNQVKGSTKGSLHVRKKLLPDAAGKQVAELKTLISTFYQYHISRTASTGTDGDRILPTAFHMDYERTFNQSQAAQEVALDNLEAGYPAAVQQAQVLLDGAFNPADYPPAEEIKSYHKCKHRFLPIPSGNAIFNALGASVAANVDEYVGEIMTAAANDAKKRLREAVERVQVQCSNPKGKIYDSLMGNIDELVATLPAIAGLTGDRELQDWLMEVRGGLQGFDAKAIKNGARTEAATAAAAIMKRMGG